MKHKSDVKIYCINLYSRDDKYKFIQEQFNKIKNYNFDIDIVRKHKHVKGGRYGCFNSHIECISDAYRLGLKYCVIMEDDCEILDIFPHTIKSCIKFINKMNKKSVNVDIIYLNSYGCAYLSEKYSEDIYKGKFLSTTCLFLTRKGMKKILSSYENYIELNYHYDHFLAQITSDTFLNLKCPTRSKNFSSDNDPWSKSNKLVTFAQQLQTYTTAHLLFRNYLVISICKYLISNKKYSTLKKLIDYSDAYNNNLAANA